MFLNTFLIAKKVWTEFFELHIRGQFDDRKLCINQTRKHKIGNFDRY